jgi:N-acylglucosamine 2-epimerase
LTDFSHIAVQCQHALTGQLIPFWLEHACDGLCGGYFDYLRPGGLPLDADKTVARQAEQVWAVAYLYTTAEAQSDWLDHALHGADFLAQFAHTPRMACYTYLSRTGQPVAPLHGPATGDALTTARVASAYAQVHLATGSDEWAMLAKQTLHTALRHYQTRCETALMASPDDPQPLRYLGEPVALLRALHDARPLFAAADWKEAAEPLLDVILNEFVDKRHDLLRDYVGVGGAFSNTPAGRRVSTGLTMETAALLIDVGTLLNNRKLVLQATNWALRFCQWTYPKEATFEGLPRYLDWKGQPLAFADAADRRAADHALTLAALANGYLRTRHPELPRWLGCLADYTFEQFPRPDGKGWKATVPSHSELIAGTESGYYGVVRGLADAWQQLEACGKLERVNVK